MLVVNYIYNKDGLRGGAPLSPYCYPRQPLDYTLTSLWESFFDPGLPLLDAL